MICSHLKPPRYVSCCRETLCSSSEPLYTGPGNPAGQRCAVCKQSVCTLKDRGVWLCCHGCLQGYRSRPYICKGTQQRIEAARVTSFANPAHDWVHLTWGCMLQMCSSSTIYGHNLMQQEGVVVPVPNQTAAASQHSSLSPTNTACAGETALTFGWFVLAWQMLHLSMARSNSWCCCCCRRTSCCCCCCLQGYYRRGDANFMLGKFKEALKDLKTVSTQPAAATTL